MLSGGRVVPAAGAEVFAGSLVDPGRTLGAAVAFGSAVVEAEALAVGGALAEDEGGAAISSTTACTFFATGSCRST